jgi:hypothetical protein
MSFRFSPSIITDGLVLYLDAANTKSYVSGSTTWSDLSRSGNNGTLVNGPTFDSADGGSIVFDGVNDYGTINTSVGSGDFTFNVWIKRQSISTSTLFLLGRYADNTDRGCMLFLQNNRLLFRIAAAVTGSVTTPTTTTLITGPNWINVAVSVNRTSNAIIYINGLIDVQTNISAQQGNVPTLNSIGSLNNTSWLLNANLGIVQIYNRALTAQEILQNYNTVRSRFRL